MLELIRNWWIDREDRPRLCAYGAEPHQDSEPRCQETITLRASTAAGHRGFCSYRHAFMAQEEAIM